MAYEEGTRENPYTTPVAMLIIGMLFAGSGAAFDFAPIVRIIMGVAALLLIAGACLLAIRRMQDDPRLKE